MIPMNEFFVFTTVVNNIERVAMHPEENYPLLYVAQIGIERDEVKQYLQLVADKYGVTFQLKHFKLEKIMEIIEPMKTRVDQ